MITFLSCWASRVAPACIVRALCTRRADQRFNGWGKRFVIARLSNYECDEAAALGPRQNWNQDHRPDPPVLCEHPDCCRLS